jgi:hypothetical protein
MTLLERFRRLHAPKFSFAKSNEFSKTFARNCYAFSMYDRDWGFGIPGYLSTENKIRGVFREIIIQNGICLFNLSGVDINRSMRGFCRYEEAANNNQITEWELFMVLTNKDYLKRCIFHNGKVQFKKRLIWKSVMS